MLAVLAAFVLGLACAYVSILLDGFVVPVMYKDGTVPSRRGAASPRGSRPTSGASSSTVSSCSGWPLRSGWIVVAGLLTCCVGLLLVALPYVGTVILLPFLVTYRAFSLEFLAQFDAGFAILPDQPAPPPPIPG